MQSPGDRAHGRAGDRRVALLGGHAQAERLGDDLRRDAQHVPLARAERGERLGEQSRQVRALAHFAEPGQREHGQRAWGGGRGGGHEDLPG
ncbi:hypothetical protein [Brachybacterium sp. GPGPB12]|uniref:hypothetical protein n=1 Tax=Brachybacterium sp. GPGPB12 TaxID=3023517 RepID=UPI0031343E4C